MARKFRTRKLGKEEVDFLVSILGEEGLNMLETDGKIPDAILNGLDRESLLKVRNIQSKIPDLPTALYSYINETQDEPVLTDDELQGRLEAYQGLGKIDFPGQTSFNTEAMSQFISDRSRQIIGKSVGGGVENTPQVINALSVASKWAADQIASGRGWDPSTFAQIVRDNGGSVISKDRLEATGQAVASEAHQGADRFLNRPTTKRDFSADIARIQEELGLRQERATKEQEVQKFLEETPAQQLASREDVADSLGESGAFFLAERGIPGIDEELNRRGLLASSGIRSARIGEIAGDVQSSIESTISQMAEEDTLVLADAAFRFELQRLEDIDANVADQILFERTKLRANEAQRFARDQQGLQDQFNLALMKRRGERSVNDVQSQSAFDLSQSQAAQRANNFNQLGQTGGQILGLGIANKLTQPKTAQPTPAGVGGTTTPKFNKLY